MDLGSPLGMLFCVGVVVGGIILLGGDVMDFIDPASILLTVMPTFGALFIAFPVKQLLRALKHMKIILGIQKYDPAYYIKTIVSMAETARAQGLIALEQQANQISDSYIKAAIQMTADGTPPDIMEERMTGSLESLTERHAESWAIYDKGAAFAPAFGMVATMVSLVNMLMNLNFDDASGVASLGLNMSAAMITTFYGSLLANVFFIPISSKLRVRHQKELFCKKLVMDGFLAISRGVGPRDINDMLAERMDSKFVRQAM